MVAACELSPLTDLCIHGQVQRIGELQSHHLDLHEGVEYIPSSESICTICVEEHVISCAVPLLKGNDRGIMVGLLPWDPEGPSCHVGPQATTTNLGLDVLVPAT